MIPLVIGTPIVQQGWRAGFVGLAVLVALTLPIAFFFIREKTDTEPRKGKAQSAPARVTVIADRNLLAACPPFGRITIRSRLSSVGREKRLTMHSLNHSMALFEMNASMLTGLYLSMMPECRLPCGGKNTIRAVLTGRLENYLLLNSRGSTDGTAGNYLIYAGD